MLTEECCIHHILNCLLYHDDHDDHDYHDYTMSNVDGIETIHLG